MIKCSEQIIFWSYFSKFSSFSSEKFLTKAFLEIGAL